LAQQNLGDTPTNSSPWLRGLVAFLKNLNQIIFCCSRWKQFEAGQCIHNVVLSPTPCTAFEEDAQLKSSRLFAETGKHF